MARTNQEQNDDFSNALVIARAICIDTNITFDLLKKIAYGLITAYDNGYHDGRSKVFVDRSV